MRWVRGVVSAPAAWVLRDLAAVAVLGVAIVPAANALSVGRVSAVHEVLTLAAAAAGAGVAILMDLAARLHDLPRLAWAGAAFAVYSIVLIPSTTLVPTTPNGTFGLQAARLAGYFVVLLLLRLAARQSRRGGAWGGWAIAVGGGVLALVIGELIALGPPALVVAVLDDAVGVVALTGWIWVSLVYLQQGFRLNRPLMWRVGLGVGLLGAAQIYRVISSTSLVQANAGFAAMRLLGLVVAGVAVGQFWLAALRAVQSGRERQSEELRVAAAHLQRAADSSARRDHELRNGIGGLLGITALLSEPQDPRDGPLRSAVLAELNRLSRMVDAGRPDEDAGADVAAVLLEVGALHRACGTEISIDVPGELCADIPDAVLRQVLANLLLNAERHAPGALVQLRGRREGTVVVVEVRDRGPGVPPGQEEAVFEPGVRDQAAGGSGLGLDISRELIAKHDGTIAIGPERPGCAVIITLMPVPTEIRTAARPADGPLDDTALTTS